MLYVMTGAVKGKMMLEEVYTRFIQDHPAKIISGDFRGFDYHKRRLENEGFVVKQENNSKHCSFIGELGYQRLFHHEIKICPLN